MHLITEYGDIIRDYCGDYRNLIIQQNNCTATRVNRHSFAGKLAEKLPYSNPYRNRKSGVFPNLVTINDHPIPGSICLKYGNGVTNPVVCCCFAQYKMGDSSVPFYMNSPKTDLMYKSTPDNFKIRLRNFAKCLNRLLNEFENNPRLDDINTVVVPGYKGCYRGGGVWSFYKSEIIKFAYQLTCIKQHIRMKIVYLKKRTNFQILVSFFYLFFLFSFFFFSFLSEYVDNYFFHLL